MTAEEYFKSERKAQDFRAWTIALLNRGAQTIRNFDCKYPDLIPSETVYAGDGYYV